MKKLLLIALLPLLVNGCMRSANHFKAMPVSKLCLDYLTSSSLNIYQGDRQNELYLRGEDCSAYARHAATIKAAKRQDALNSLANSKNEKMMIQMQNELNQQTEELRRLRDEQRRQKLLQ